MKRVTMIVLAGLVTACSDMNLHDMGAGAEDTGNTWDTEGTGDSGAIDSPDPYWFGLDAQIEILEGAVVSVAPTLRLWPEDSTLGELCTDFPEVVSFEAAEVPDPLVYHWVALDLADDSGACIGAERVPRQMVIGLGELYEPIVPGVEQHGLGDVRDSLYGSYASFEAPVGDGLDGTTFAYGYAGTEQDRLGETEAVSAGPLPDGSYQITAWYLFQILP